MDDLSGIDDTYPIQKPVEAFRRRAWVTGEKPPLYLAREEREHRGRNRNAAKRLRCFLTDDDITASAFVEFAVDLKCFRQPQAGGCEHAE